ASDEAEHWPGCGAGARGRGRTGALLRAGARCDRGVARLRAEADQARELRRSHVTAGRPRGRGAYRARRAAQGPRIQVSPERGDGRAAAPARALRALVDGPTHVLNG